MDETIDPTSLNQRTTQTTEQVSQIKPARELLQSVIKTNPGYGHGGMAAACLNKLTDSIVQARSAIVETKMPG